MARSDVKNFEYFVGIDWSGAASPVFTRSIAMATCARGSDSPHVEAGPWSRTKIADWIVDRAGRGIRTLIGIDCNFGYASEVGAALYGAGYTAPDLWAAVDGACAGTPNYFAGPYWLAHVDLFWMSGKKLPGFTMPRRVTEQCCGECGYGWPESPFKLIGAKQVGKGGLSGMRMVHDLKKRCGDNIAIWPFEPKLVDDATIVITEIYPRLFLRRAGMGNGKIRALADLTKGLEYFKSQAAKVDQFSDHTSDAIISAAGLRWICGDEADIPAPIAIPSCDPRILRQEGWIFGAGG